MTRTSDKHAIPEGEDECEPDAYDEAGRWLFDRLVWFFELIRWVFRGEAS